jgi:hypothetical protein
MKQSEAKKILLQAFTVATTRHLKNWQYHLDKNTPVLCGELAVHYNINGGG